MASTIQKTYLPFFRIPTALLTLICLNVNVNAQVSSRLPVPGYQDFNARIPDSNQAAIDFSPGTGQLVSGTRQRVWLIAGSHLAAWGASYIALNKAWYAGYPKSDFHFFNDNGEWNQMDKCGHTWTAYQMSRLSARLWKWSGLNERQSAWLGGAAGLAYQSIIEIQDGFSSEWGFSWGDMTANTVGAATFVAQQLGWHEQRLQFKLSYWPYDYNSPELVTRRDQLFGKSLPERMLKDYNSQTYWLSANVHAFFPGSNWPAWLNIAIGYNSNGMLGGYENKWTDKQGNTFSRYDIPRERHFLLSPDIDLTRIKTNNKFLRSVLYIANMVKIPAPAIALSKGKFKLYALYY
ncbi:hypothetical protein A3860_27730 [Niastella vici]|uniref:DUF2279 domain-containing protein n=1 Tax=Niastella vici TaxID=1703345 RepID=A0A1V9FW71_9BACT|nr:hypothetical protein A3860_27730 [Niastella vici]